MINDINYDYTFEIKKAKMSNVLLGNNKKNIIDIVIKNDKNINNYEEFFKILELDNAESKYKNIKNFLRYRILIKSGIVNGFDCDNLSCVKEILKKYIENKIKNINIKYDEDKRYFNINDWIFETDTANSFQTIFGEYMRIAYKEKYQEYIKVYSVKPNEVLRDFYLLINIDNFFSNDDEVLNKFDELAAAYHKIGNFVLVPYGYNSLRNKLYDDYYDLSIKGLREKYWENFYDRSKDDLFKILTGEEFILKFSLSKGDLKSKNRQDINEKFINCISNMITFINNRGKDIVDTIEK